MHKEGKGKLKGSESRRRGEVLSKNRKDREISRRGKKRDSNPKQIKVGERKNKMTNEMGWKI